MLSSTQALHTRSDVGVGSSSTNEPASHVFTPESYPALEPLQLTVQIALRLDCDLQAATPVTTTTTTTTTSTTTASGSCPYADEANQRFDALDNLSPATAHLLGPNGELELNGTSVAVVTGFAPVWRQFSIVVDAVLAGNSAGYLFSKATSAGSHFYALYYSLDTQTLYFYHTPVGSAEFVVTYIPLASLVTLSARRVHRFTVSVENTALRIAVDDTVVHAGTLSARIKDCEGGDCLLYVGARPSSTGPLFFMQGVVRAAALRYCETALPSSPHSSTATTTATATVTTTTTTTATTTTTTTPTTTATTTTTSSSDLV